MHHVTKLKSLQIGFLNMSHDNEFTVLKWHPQSPDLNSIWDLVERKLRALDMHPKNLHQLQHAMNMGQHF